MLPTQIYTFQIAASETYNLMVAGEYFKILDATGKLKVRAEFGELDGIGKGQGLEKTPFSKLSLTNKTASANDVILLIGDENFIDGLSGSMEIFKTVPPRANAFINTAKTVTNASAVMVAVKLDRSYLLIQNKDSAGDIYVTFGAAATLANGIKIGPGGSYELNATVTTQDVYAIGSMASNANILVVEG
jgi:hypothetical protein